METKQNNDGWEEVPINTTDSGWEEVPLKKKDDITASPAQPTKDSATVSGQQSESGAEDSKPINLPDSYQSDRSNYKDLIDGGKYNLLRGGKKITGTWDAVRKEFIKSPLLDLSPQPTTSKGAIQTMVETAIPSVAAASSLESEEDVLSRTSIEVDKIKSQAAKSIGDVEYYSQFKPLQTLIELKDAAKTVDDDATRSKIEAEIQKLSQKKLSNDDFYGAIITDKEEKSYSGYMPSIRKDQQFVPISGAVKNLPKTDMTVGELYNEYKDNVEFIAQAQNEVGQWDNLVRQKLISRLPEDKRAEVEAMPPSPETDEIISDILVNEGTIEDLLPAIGYGLNHKLDALYKLGGNIGLSDNELISKKLTEIRKDELFGKRPDGFKAEIGQSVGGMLPDIAAGVAAPEAMLLSMMSTMPNDYLGQSIYEDYMSGKDIDVSKAKKYAATSTIAQGGLMMATGKLGGGHVLLTGKKPLARAGQLLYEVAKRGTKDAFTFGLMGGYMQNKINELYDMNKDDQYLNSMLHMFVIGGLFAAKEGLGQVGKVKLPKKTQNEVDYLASFLPSNYTKEQIKALIKAGKITEQEGEEKQRKLDDFRTITNELPVEVTYSVMDKIYPLWQEKQSIIKAMNGSTDEFKSVFKGQIKDLDRKILIEAAVPLTSEELTQLGKLKKQAVGEGGADMAELKYLEARKDAAKVAEERVREEKASEEKAKEETIKRQQEQKAAEEQAVEPKPEVTTTQVVETPAETVSEAVVEQPKSEVSTVSGEGVSGSALKDKKADIERRKEELEKKYEETKERHLRELEKAGVDLGKWGIDFNDIIHNIEEENNSDNHSKEVEVLAKKQYEEWWALNREKQEIESDANRLSFSDYNFSNKQSILDRLKKAISKVYQSNRQALDEGFAEWYNVEREVATVGGNQYAAHGMGKTSIANAFTDLINLFEKGINPFRGQGALDVATLAGGISDGTTTGGAYMDGAFTLVANRNHNGRIENINQIGGIIVNEGIATPEVLSALKELFPNLVIESTLNSKSLVEQLNAKYDAELAALEETSGVSGSALKEVGRKPIGNGKFVRYNPDDVLPLLPDYKPTNTVAVEDYVNETIPNDASVEAYKTVPIDAIKTSEKIENKDRAEIDKIKEGIKNGDDIPPVVLDFSPVIKNGEQYQFGLMDGHHRYIAYKELGIKEIPAAIITSREHYTFETNDTDVKSLFKAPAQSTEAESKAITEPSEGVKNFEAALNERTDKKRDKALKNFGDKEADARRLIEDYDTNIEKLKAQGIEPTGTKAEVLADMLSGKYDEQLAKQSQPKKESKSVIRQKAINKLLNLSDEYNDMSDGPRGKGSSDGQRMKMRLKEEAERLGLKLEERGKIVFVKNKNGNKVKRNFAFEGNKAEAEDYIPFEQRSKETQSIFNQLSDNVANMPAIYGADGKKMSSKQLASAISDVVNGNATNGAKLLLDQLDAYNSEGNFEISDPVLGKTSVPIQEYLDITRGINEEAQRLSDEMSNEEVNRLADEYWNSLTDEQKEQLYGEYQDEQTASKMASEESIAGEETEGVESESAEQAFARAADRKVRMAERNAILEEAFGDRADKAKHVFKNFKTILRDLESKGKVVLEGDCF